MFRIANPPTDWQPSGPIVRAAEHQALANAAEIIAGAEAEAERIRQEASEEYTRRQAEGYADGIAKAEAEHTERLVAFASDSIRSIRGVESKLVNVVEKALKKIIGEIDARDRIASLVHTALVQHATEGKIKLRVATEDLESARNAVGQMPASESIVEFASDARLPAGSCILESNAGVLDASLDVQINAIVRALRATFTGDGNAEATP